eukprot:gene857-298_t
MSKRSFCSKVQVAARRVPPPPPPFVSTSASSSWQSASKQKNVFVDGKNDRQRLKRTKHCNIGEVAITQARVGDTRAAKIWLEQSRHEPSEHAFNSLLTAHAQRGEVHSARRVMGQMVRARIRPNVHAFGSMIQTCANAEDANLAEQWFYCMQNRFIQPNPVHYVGVLSAHGACGNIEKAHYWFDKFLTKFPERRRNPMSYSSLIRAYTTNLDGVGAEKILVKMLAASAKPNVVSYTNVLTAYTNSGDIISSYQIITKMAVKKIIPDVVTAGSLLTICHNPTEVKELLYMITKVWQVELHKRFIHRLREKLGVYEFNNITRDLDIRTDDRKRMANSERPVTGAATKNRNLWYKERV